MSNFFEPKHNKPRALFPKKKSLAYLSCCPEESDPCCSANGNDPTPPSNCGWNLLIDDGRPIVSVAVPNNSTYVLDGGLITIGADAVITFELQALASPGGAIQVVTSGAAGLDGGSTYVGAVPLVPVGNTALVGTLTLDTDTPGTFQTVITITTDCGNMAVTVDYQVGAPTAACEYNVSYQVVPLIDNGNGTYTIDDPNIFDDNYDVSAGNNATVAVLPGAPGVGTLYAITFTVTPAVGSGSITVNDVFAGAPLVPITTVPDSVPLPTTIIEGSSAYVAVFLLDTSAPGNFQSDITVETETACGENFTLDFNYSVVAP